MKLLIDMNLSPAWVDFLRYNGLQAEHWSNVGAPSASDVEIMTYARREGMIVLTHDLDFSSILAATHGDKPSVVQIRAADVSPASIGAGIVRALEQMKSELDQGALLTINPSRAKLRILPL